MLQIVTGMYFRPGVRLNSTMHRAVLYTNRGFIRSEEIELPVGNLLPSTGFPRVSTVTVSVTERLEAVRPDGTDDILIASSGKELIDDLADVLSFALNAVFSSDHDLVHRLVPASAADRRRSSASNQLRGTFDQLLIVTDAEIEDLRGFMTRLLDLRRPEFEAAMKAIRRIVRAWQNVADDPTIAYTDIVAALESLSATDQRRPGTDLAECRQSEAKARRRGPRRRRRRHHGEGPASGDRGRTRRREDALRRVRSGQCFAGVLSRRSRQRDPADPRRRSTASGEPRL